MTNPMVWSKSLTDIIRYQEDPPWIRKGSWKMTRSTFVNLCTTEKCDISIFMYFTKQIQWCDQYHIWTSFLESGRSFLDQEGFLKDDHIYVGKFFSNREVWYINLYLLCETNSIVWSKLLMDIIRGVRKILHGSGRVPEGCKDPIL